MIRLPYRRVLQFFVYCLVFFVLAACSLTSVGRQVSAVDDLSTLQGTVQVAADALNQPVQVLLLRHNKMGLEKVSQQTLFSDGSYLFYATPGKYTVAAFVDINGDTKYSDAAPATYFGEKSGKPTILDIGKGDSLTVPKMTVKGPLLSNSGFSVVDASSLSSSNIGRLAALGDERFSSIYSTMGMWRPVDFVNEVGAGLFFLQDYEKDKIPVLFIHGINGSPDNFKAIISALDVQVFQPWVFQYPSGLPLQVISDYLLISLERLRVQYDFDQIYLVAHSMGGLMARSFVLKHKAKNSAIELGLVVTINSPLLGMESAAIGVRTSPVVLPVWRDLASNSDYVARVHASPWPSNIPYHLVFSFKDGEDGDGVVPMRSQLSWQLQQEARDIHGFNTTHSGILEDRNFIQALNEILASP